LASLLLAAVFRALTVVKQVQNRNEISQLAAAIASFKTNRGVDYVPSSFSGSDPTGASQQFWNAAFGGNAGAPPAVSLQGHQCLVFFLGGVQQNGTCMGFSSNPRNPMAAPFAGEIRIGPFYTFNAARLMANGGYADIYGSPFAYFSTTGSINSYNPGDCAGVVGAGGGSSPIPYSSPGGGYVMPNGFQIISAGADGVFGSAGVWPSTTMTRPGGYDDISNFATTILGSQNQ
jgi:hypothetical protein